MAPMSRRKFMEGFVAGAALALLPSCSKKEVCYGVWRETSSEEVCASLKPGWSSPPSFIGVEEGVMTEMFQDQMKYLMRYQLSETGSEFVFFADSPESCQFKTSELDAAIELYRELYDYKMLFSVDQSYKPPALGYFYLHNTPFPEEVRAALIGDFGSEIFVPNVFRYWSWTDKSPLHPDTTYTTVNRAVDLNMGYPVDTSFWTEIAQVLDGRTGGSLSFMDFWKGDEDLVLAEQRNNLFGRTMSFAQNGFDYSTYSANGNIKGATAGGPIDVELYDEGTYSKFTQIFEFINSEQ